ncbi:MAG: MTH865 family protein [Haloplanus sp.]
MPPEAEIRRQLTAVFDRAQYPVTDPLELVRVLPDGAATTFEAGTVTIGAMELGMEYADYQEYPYDDVGALVDDLMAGLGDDGVFE